MPRYASPVAVAVVAALSLLCSVRVSATAAPSAAPTFAPSFAPSAAPSAAPSFAPSAAPSTATPSAAPSIAPTAAPTYTPCLVGRYMNITNTTCIPCSVGTYANTTSATVCTACAEGYFAGSTGTSACTLCGAGYYTVNATGASVCSGCAAGKYNDGTLTTCAVCAAGRYIGTANATECTPAPAGSYVNATGATSASLCTAGTFAADTGSGVCTDCTGATISAAGATVCAPCPLGYDSLDHVSCGVCGTGSSSSGVLGQSCSACAGGTYGPATANAVCLPCPVGTFSPVAGGASTCTNCSAGTTSAAGATACLPVTVAQPTTPPPITSAKPSDASAPTAVRDWFVQVNASASVSFYTASDMTSGATGVDFWLPVVVRNTGVANANITYRPLTGHEVQRVLGELGCYTPGLHVYAGVVLDLPATSTFTARADATPLPRVTQGQRLYRCTNRGLTPLSESLPGGCGGDAHNETGDLVTGAACGRGIFVWASSEQYQLMCRGETWGCKCNHNDSWRNDWNGYLFIVAFSLLTFAALIKFVGLAGGYINLKEDNGVFAEADTNWAGGKADGWTVYVLGAGPATVVANVAVYTGAVVFATAVLTVNAAELDPYTDPAGRDPAGARTFYGFFVGNQAAYSGIYAAAFAVIAFDLLGVTTWLSKTSNAVASLARSMFVTLQALTLAVCLVLIVPLYYQSPLPYAWLIPFFAIVGSVLARGLSGILSFFLGDAGGSRRNEYSMAFFQLCLIAIYGVSAWALLLRPCARAFKFDHYAF